MRIAIMMTLHHQNHLITLTLATLLSGCASMPDNLAANGTMKVERVDSRDAHIEIVQVRAVTFGLKISGRLRKRYHGRGVIPGHLHIKIIDRNGEILAQTTSGYQRRSVKTRRSSFSTTISMQQGEVSTIEVIHHGLSDKHG